MGFWGIEVKPGKAHPYHSDNVRGKLHVTQATLGSGSSIEKSILQCSIGQKKPIYLCSLLPDKNECCPLNLEFEDDDDLVSFSVIGSRSIYLSGYFESDDGDYIQDKCNGGCCVEGIDIAETESDESSEYDYEDDDDGDFIDDDDLVVYQSSPIRNKGVIIEEIDEEEKPAKETKSKQAKKKNQSDDNENTQKQIIAKGSGQTLVLESEDEDGFPISKAGDEEPGDKIVEKKKVKDVGDNVSGQKRKVNNTEQDGKVEREPKKKKKKQKEKRKGGNADGPEDETDEQTEKENKMEEEKTPDLNDAKNVDKLESSVASDSLSEKKKKNKKKKNKKQEANGAMNKTVSDENKSTLDSEENQTNSKSSQVRTYPNGLVVEELAMGKPDGKRASPGKQVSVRYIGKLKKSGKIFDSNIGRAPFKFRLGLGQVIKGWDVGVNGMRVGDKRRLTIPASMGYGERGAGGTIPPNAWLMFDVELIDVR